MLLLLLFLEKLSLGIGSKYALSKRLDALAIENNEDLKKLGGIKHATNIMLANNTEELKLLKPKKEPHTNKPNKVKPMISPSARDKGEISKACFDPHTRFFATQSFPFKVNIWNEKGEWEASVDTQSHTRHIILTGEKDHLIIGTNRVMSYKITKLIYQGPSFEKKWGRTESSPVNQGGHVMSIAFDSDKKLFGLSAIEENKQAQEQKKYYLRIGSYEEEKDTFIQIEGEDSALMSINFIPESSSVLCGVVDTLDVKSSDVAEKVLNYTVKIIDYEKDESIEYKEVLPCANAAGNLKNTIALNKENICAFASGKDIHLVPLRNDQGTCSFMETRLLKNAHKKDITSLVFHPTEPLLASCSKDDSTIKIWNIKNHYCLGTIVHMQDLPQIIGFTSKKESQNSLYEIYVLANKKMFKETIYCSKGLTPKQCSVFEYYLQAIKDKKEPEKSLEEAFNTLPNSYKEHVAQIKLPKNPPLNQAVQPPLKQPVPPQSWLPASVWTTLNWIKQKVSNPWVSVSLATGALISGYALWNRYQKSAPKK